MRKALFWGVLFFSYLAVPPTLGIKTCSLSEVKGLLLAVFTSVDKDGRLDTSNIPQYARYLSDNKADGVVVSATWGEGPTMNVSDNKLLLDAWMAAAPPLGLFVILEIGAEPLSDTLEMAAYSEEVGVDAIMVLPPVYYRPETPVELVYYMQFIYDAAPNTPLIYDHYPEFTDVDVNMEEFFDLATDEIPTFKGVKTNEFDVALLLKNKINEDQRIYVADAILLGPAVLMGFDSFMVSQLGFLPDLVVGVVVNGQNGNLNVTRAKYQELLELSKLIAEEGDRIAAEKTAASLITGIYFGPVRPPLIPLNDEQEASLVQTLKKENIPIVGSL